MIAEDREPLQVAPDTVLVEPANAPRYGKSSLLTPKKDKQGNWQWTDLRRAVGHATYLLNTHDPGGQARAAGKVGLISFKDCVDTIGDALNIPKYRRMWFWGSRGSNALEDCDILLLVGTPALAPDEVEEYARDLHRQGPQPIVGGREKDPTTGRERFKDPRVQALADHLTNGETTQCAHRCRAVQHQGRMIINLGHGVIGDMAGARIITDELPAQITPAGQVKNQANLEQAIQNLIAAYQKLQAVGVSTPGSGSTTNARHRSMCAWTREVPKRLKETLLALWETHP